MNSLRLRSSSDEKQAAALRVDALVTAARNGSLSAFEELQALYSQPIFNTILRITKNKEDAEDALQDTFLRVFLSLRNFEGRSSFYSWLTRIAINSALMLLRKRRVRSEISIEPPTETSNQPLQFEPRDRAPDPEHACIQRQLYARTLRSIERLDPKLRSAIMLQATCEYSMKDIARKLESTEAAVKSRLHRARARLISRAPATSAKPQQSAFQALVESLA